MTPEAIEDMAAGYREVDRLLAAGVDLLSYGGTRRLLELNHVVLCGTDPARREQYRGHVAATERLFYGRADAGVASLYDWSRRHAGLGPVERAAGLFLRSVSSPQLFLEGNRRTATLLASHTLARAGRPPMVVTAAAFPRYAALADRCAAVERDAISSLLERDHLASRLRALIGELADPGFLLRADLAPGPARRP
jgi:hypothetical protein